jgi:hypothetical protein
MLVGKSGAAFRALLSFGLGSVPTLYTISGAQLDVWTDSSSSGTMQTMELRALSRSFNEGTGSGASSANGAGTGADWLTHDGTAEWTSAGGDFDGAVLSSVPGFDAATTLNTQQTFTSSPALLSAVTTALASGTPLNLVILSPLTEAASGTNFVRLASDDYGTHSRRPQLTLIFAHPFVPAIDPGPAQSAIVGTPVTLNGIVSNATTSAWSLESGPGPVSFINPTTVKFSTPGVHVLRLSATNANGESSATLQINVLTQQQNWRFTHFGTVENSGNAADTFDANGDGESNLMEFATGQNPHATTLTAPALVKNGATLELTYTRSIAAMNDGVSFTPEWRDDLTAGVWSSAGVTEQILTDNGTVQTVRASVAAGSGARFLHLKITRP